MQITTLEPQVRHAGRWNVSLDGRFAFGADESVVLAEGLAVGMELTEDDVARIQARESEQRLLDAAIRFLTPRPRSRIEVRRRLLRPHPKRPTPSPEAVERMLDRLEQQGLLNDRDFAGFWVENRERFSPRSARALGQELRQRGVDRETANEMADPDRDDARARSAGRQRLRSLAGLDYETFRSRLSSFLLRRGFSYGVVRETVRHLWEETHGAAPENDDEDEDAGMDE
ncbi:MAG: regulatory protein RecX [Chloroflexota bacterium]